MVKHHLHILVDKQIVEQIQALARAERRSVNAFLQLHFEKAFFPPSSPNGSSPPALICNTYIPPSSLTSSSPLKKISVKPKQDDHFEDFWAAYPRRVGKAAARRSWEKAMKVTTPDVIGAALRAAEWPEDPQYIPHPATWLNQGRWDDQPAPVILKERPEDELARLWGEVRE